MAFSPCGGGCANYTEIKAESGNRMIRGNAGAASDFAVDAVRGLFVVVF